MKVLIAGANGHTGRLLIEYLSACTPHEPYAMIRDEDQAENARALGAKGIVLADLEKDVSHAPEGMDAIIFAAGSGSKTGPDKTIAVDRDGAKKLIDAAVEHKCGRFIMLSSMGADDPQGPLEHYLLAKREADDYVTGSGLTYTIIRPGPLTFDEPSEKVEIGEKLELLEDRSIPRGDVARILALALSSPLLENRTVEVLQGPYSIEEAIKRLPDPHSPATRKRLSE